MDFDPAVHWRKVQAPVLAISGGRDVNSDVHASQRQLRQILASAGNRDFTGVIYPNMEHGGVEWWLPFRLPPPRFPEGYSDLLINWTISRVGHCAESRRASAVALRLWCEAVSGLASGRQPSCLRCPKRHGVTSAGAPGKLRGGGNDVS